MYDVGCSELTEVLSPMANHEVVYRSNLFKNRVGYAMFRFNRDREGSMLSFAGVWLYRG